MARRVPVLRQHHMVMTGDQMVDQRHDLVAVFHGERAAGAEIVLDVDDEQRLRDGKGRTLLPSGGPIVTRAVRQRRQRGLEIFLVRRAGAAPAPPSRSPRRARNCDAGGSSSPPPPAPRALPNGGGISLAGSQSLTKIARMTGGSALAKRRPSAAVSRLPEHGQYRVDARIGLVMRFVPQRLFSHLA
jgi:hypothetical protein